MSQEMVRQALKESFTKLNPVLMMRNPVMFVVEAGTLVVLLMTIFPSYFGTEGSIGFNLTVFVILLFTLLFANFAEALAEGRGKAQADSLKQSKQEMTARKVMENGGVQSVSSTALRKGDIVMVAQGEMIPGDGEVIAGLASVDESAITGESAPVIKEAGGDFSSVTGGPGLSAIRSASGLRAIRGIVYRPDDLAGRRGLPAKDAKRNCAEYAVDRLNADLPDRGCDAGTDREVSWHRVDRSGADLAAGMSDPDHDRGLLSAIGIAGMDRVTQFNVLAMSGKAVEAAGDINTMILDKTGTITFGNRMASRLIPVGGESLASVSQWAAVSSLQDETPEGRSVLELLRKEGFAVDESMADGAEFIEFKAETRMSGMDLRDGRKVRKGAVDAVKAWVQSQGGPIPSDLSPNSDAIATEGEPRLPSPWITASLV